MQAKRGSSSVSPTRNCYVDLALVGALGDMQYPLEGLNREIADAGIKQGLIEERTDLVLFGKVSRSVRSMLVYADPYLPGITGNEELSRAIILGAGIEEEQNGKWASYYDLPQEQRLKLVSSLVRFLAEGGYDHLAKSLIGTVYLLPGRVPELREAHEFSTMLNACGRNGRYDLGVQLCLGDFSAEAADLLAKHRKNLRDAISFAFSNVQDVGPFHLIDGRGVISENIIGVVCGMLYSSAKKDKPIIGLSIDEENRGIKISSRAAKSLVESGVNLGTAMKECSASVGGIGGGHKVAAGATIPAEKLESFLVFLGEHFSNSKMTTN